MAFGLVTRDYRVLRLRRLKQPPPLRMTIKSRSLGSSVAAATSSFGMTILKTEALGSG